ncbi:MAG: porphobilinogen synthase [Lachnospirales bacterium]
MKRTRPLRINKDIRNLVRETTLNIKDFIYPMFIMEGSNIVNPIKSMPGINQYSLDTMNIELNRVVESGIKGVLIFGIPSHKDEVGSEAYNENGITQKAIKNIKENYPSLFVVADVCLCEYTSHGHCGIINDNTVENDATVELLAKAALSLAKAGADIIAPSDMMDGRVLAIRSILDENGFKNLPIMSYSAKYASGYYAPFRDAAHSTPSLFDRKTYQMDVSNRKEALIEIEEDIAEGADIVMIKPALAYLDIIRDASNNFNLPICAYNVSGEYSMVKLAGEMGYIDTKKIIFENLTAIKRAGASIIITYHAIEVANWIKEENFEY